jgi:hypothetical protein
MRKRAQKTVRAFAMLIAFATTITTATPQERPRSGIYEIRSGFFLEVGGIRGMLSYRLPDSFQAFVSLSVPEVGPAELKFLNQKRQPVFPQLTNGIVSGNTIRFQSKTVHPIVPTLFPQADYTVTSAAGMLWISGSITSPPVCCDIPNQWQHQSVVARLVPAPSICLAGDVQLRWSSVSNQNYQVQCASAPSGVTWTNLGEPIPGNGMTNCWRDATAPAPTQRFYRILTSP